MIEETPPAAADLLGEIAASTAKETAAAVVPPPSIAPAGESAPTDRWGRKFDPLLHKVKADGSPQLRAGRTLIKLPGAPAGDSTIMPGASATPQGSRRLAVGAGGPEPGQAAADPGELDQAGADQAQADSAGIPELSPDEFDRRAHTGARMVRKALHRLGRIVAGGDAGDYIEKHGFNEGKDIEDSTFDIQKESGRLVPAAGWIMLGVAVGSYAFRVWNTDHNQDRVADFISNVTGRPRPPKSRIIEQPNQHQQNSPAPAPEPLDGDGQPAMADDPFNPKG